MEVAFALVRNSLFVVKAVLPASTWKLLLEPFFGAKDPAVLALSPYFASLIVKISLVDYTIGFSQLGASVFNTKAGLRDIWTGLQLYRKYDGYIGDLDARCTTATAIGLLEYSILWRSLQADKRKAVHQVVAGCAEMVFGVGFCILFCNTMRVFDGNPKVVIDSIATQEWALLYFLFVMFSTVRSKQQKARALRSLSAKLNESDKEMIPVSQAIAVASYAGFQDNITDVLDIVMPHFGSPLSQLQFPTYNKYASVTDISIQGFSVNASLLPVEVDFHILSSLLVPEPTAAEAAKTAAATAAAASRAKTPTSPSGKSIFPEGTAESAAHANCVAAAPLAAAAQQQATTLELEVLFDWLYLALNVLAFFGYALACAVFYFPASHACSPFLQSVDLHRHLSDGGADWFGNLLGDTCWTIEPFVILFVAPLIKNLLLGSGSSSSSGSSETDEVTSTASPEKLQLDVSSPRSPETAASVSSYSPPPSVASNTSSPSRLSLGSSPSTKTPLHMKMTRSQSIKVAETAENKLGAKKYR